MLSIKQSSVFELLHQIRHKIDLLISPFKNIKKYWKIINGDVDWDTDDIVLDFLEIKLQKFYEFCLSDDAMCEHDDDIKDHFNNSLRNFYNWLMNEFDKDYDSEILLSVKTYLYCFELLNKTREYQFEHFDEELYKLNKQVSKILGDGLVMRKKTEEEKKILETFYNKTDNIEDKCYLLLSKLFEKRCLEKFWD